MCGIAGVVGGPSPEPELLARMAQRMAHRGPDGQAIWADERAGLAFRRLAIIDLDDRSMQPMDFGPWRLVFNGEIYNYRELREELRGLGHLFVTEGDGEVLLHAWAEWEEEALDRFDGMFAFALWHDERRELICACDPFGEKPLYWANDGERLVFASDIRAVLLARPDLGAPRTDALAPYLARGLMPPIDRSFFAGIHRLPGSHLLRFRDGRPEVRRYWQPRMVTVPDRYEDAVEQLRELLLGSIGRRLRSDVAVGTSLSGGVDSSAVAALAAAFGGGHVRHAFTATFPGFARDEWTYADDVARAARVSEHHAVEPTSSGLLEELDRVVAGQEEPFGSTSIYAQWCVMRSAREAGVTVLLDGQGADEIFGGYPGSNGWAIRSMGSGAVLRGLASSHDRQDVLLAIGSERLAAPIARHHRRRLATPYATAEVADEGSRVKPAESGVVQASQPLTRELLRQCFHTSLPELLRYADRSSMANSREVRLPFLDKSVAQFALSLPAEFVYRDGITKAVLRDAVRDIVPAPVLGRADKVGFEPPQADWLAEAPWIERVTEVLLDRTARARGLYRTDLIEADAQHGRWRDPSGIWRALNLELWLGMVNREEAS